MSFWQRKYLKEYNKKAVGTHGFFSAQYRTGSFKVLKYNYFKLKNGENQFTYLRFMI
jgi:hypothetical protein